jgi:hypothetical protein
MPAPAGRVTSAIPFLTDSVVGASLQNHDGVSSSSSCQLSSWRYVCSLSVQVVTWGHPCCFERAKRRAGTPDENRAWFHVTVDLCREQWLILHKIDYVEEMR